MNNSLHKDINIDKFKAINDNLSSYDFLSAVRNNPNLALQYDNFRRSSVSNKGWADRFNDYISRKKTLPLLQKYHMISLDTFRKYRYSDIIKGNIEIKKCDYDEDVYEKPLTDQMLRDRLAFLSLFVTETVDEAIAIQNIFPELSEIFNEMNEYLARPEEVLGMFSEALRILNHNTAVLMVDEYRKKYQEMENNLKKEMKEKMQEIQEMQEMQERENNLKKEMQERENNLKKEMQERENNIKKEMQEQQKILDDKDKQINSQEEQHKKDLERIAELEAMLKESRESKESNGQG